MPVIMLSSKTGCSTAPVADGGSDQYLTKPFTKESLLKTVAIM
jgi:DNA-binding response OmpR family regulator